ncbi:ABC transporter permease [Halalkalibacter sp. AB-rgal2]|uniref:ABC transporter permease n=1 Tax=Halalkalibacter sp. AB-rgal2 TaxID=3242695 RepID=UPI00359D6B4B
MSFNQIVWKMVKAHYKKYIFYFLCNSLAVMLFFLFSTLFFNEDIAQVKETESIGYVLAVPGIALVVFTMLFISYAHSIFIKRRNSEFGLFITLGMTNRDVSKLLLIENGIIGSISLVTGIVAGSLFSRLFFYLLTSSVGINSVSYHLNIEMFLYTSMVFLIVFVVAVGRTLFLIVNQRIILTLKSDRVSEEIKMKSPLLGKFGIAIIILSILGLYFTYTGSNGGDYLLIWTTTTWMGLYISINQFTSYFIDLIKKNKAYYYKRMLSLSSLEYKFKQLTSTLMLVTVMIMVTILYSTIMLFTYIENAKQAIKENPYDIAFFQTDSKNNLTEEELYSIINQPENPIHTHVSLPIYSYFQQERFSGWTYVYHVMSIDDFNHLTSNQIKIGDKEFIYYINQQSENNDSDYDLYFTFPNVESEENYTHRKTIVEKNLNNVSLEFILVNDFEMKHLKNKKDGFESTIHLINVANWEETYEVVEELQERFTTFNEATSPIVDEEVEGISETDLFRIVSKVEAYNRNKTTNGISFFVTAFLSVLFFFASFVLLYLNLFSNIDKEKAKVKKLHHIGVTTIELKRMISNELTPIFFIPTIIGTILAFLFITAMSTDIGGIVQNPNVVLYFLVVSGTYHVIQLGFYLYARKKMFLYLINKSEIDVKME